MTWYIYEVESRMIAEEHEGEQEALEAYYNDYDVELYGVTGSPAFGANDGLVYSTELQSGVYLFTQEEIISEYQTWGEEDESNNIDFTTYRFWITTDNGVTPQGFDSIEAARLSLL